MKDKSLLRAQRAILNLVAGKYPHVYLVGGTAISLLYRHRISEDLDFFTQRYSGKLHRDIAAWIESQTGFPSHLIAEEKRRTYVPMAVYEFETGKDAVLKVDFVKDIAALIQPRRDDGIASPEDVYYRKILAVIGWIAGRSRTGQVLAGGRQKAKDLFDIFYLSANVLPLSIWFPRHFSREAYERLAAWYLGVPRQRTVMELLELVPGCDTKTIFKELDDQVIHKLNRVYLSL
ncbi:MAG: nucleotidyl transferase AbiEii/AbiGii toxin family protein [Candidatus Omnitrophica bacterium]|nr:nucleotidyl transferase AbiEii/AbiGii toxin family protein [Candidatus Omnitrophota bacterium]